MTEQSTSNDLAAIVPMDLMQRAVTNGADIAVLEKLMGLQERWEANQARKAFDAALSAAKAEIPTIKKTRQVNFKSSKGHTQYAYEDLADIAETVGSALSKNGMSYRWRTAVVDGNVIVTCVLSHRDGHSEENSLPAGRDHSGNKNDIQALGSAVTYLERYTLKAALGLAAAADDNEDDDGQAAVKPEPSIETYEDAAEYLTHWGVIIANARDPDALRARWDKEREGRREIRWPPGQPAQLAETVGKRIQELKTVPETT